MYRYNIEKEMEKIGSAIDNNEKIDFVTRHFKDSASQWCSIIRDNITTYRQFRVAFENRYWNIHIQRQVRRHFMDHITAVSYTHLDVYKRQINKCNWNLAKISPYLLQTRKMLNVFYKCFNTLP